MSLDILTACANRLGNRANNQDRSLVQRVGDRVLLAVADGMGGHARGELAAQVAVDSLARSFLSYKGASIDDPHTFLEQALHHAHLAVVDAGRAEQPPVTPRTTCVTCLVQGDRLWWAYLGDSRLYLIRRAHTQTRTRDHTPVEELLRQGLIEETEISSHPLRNSVSRCLGGSLQLPEVSLGEATLEREDTLLLCSDGLWSALPEASLQAIPVDGDLEQAVNHLADEAETASYPHSDNISLVALRWLSASGTQTVPRPAAAPAHKPAEPHDPVQQAIDDIHRAMLEYASEMKK